MHRSRCRAALVAAVGAGGVIGDGAVVVSIARAVSGHEDLEAVGTHPKRVRSVRPDPLPVVASVPELGAVFGRVRDRRAVEVAFVMIAMAAAGVAGAIATFPDNARSTDHA